MARSISSDPASLRHQIERDENRFVISGDRPETGTKNHTGTHHRGRTRPSCRVIRRLTALRKSAVMADAERASNTEPEPSFIDETILQQKAQQEPFSPRGKGQYPPDSAPQKRRRRRIRGRSDGRDQTECKGSKKTAHEDNIGLLKRADEEASGTASRKAARQ